MTALSIPERAREDKINELIAKYGMSPDSGLAQAWRLNAAIRHAASEAIRSERDQCVLELMALALANTEHARIIMDAANSLREGGQK